MFQYDEDVSQHDDDVSHDDDVHCGPSENLTRSIAMRHEIKSFLISKS